MYSIAESLLRYFFMKVFFINNVDKFPLKMPTIQSTISPKNKKLNPNINS